MSASPTAACCAPSATSSPVIRYWLAVAAFLYCMAAPAQVTIDAVPGGVVEIPLAPLDKERPRAYFGQKRVLTLAAGSRWAGIVGLPLTMVPGRYVLQASLPDSEEPVDHEFTVYPRRITGPAVVDHPDMPLDADEITLEWRDTLDAELPLNPPVPLPAQPLFGRFPRSSSSEAAYLDFVAFRIASDSTVTAPDKGRISHMESREQGAFICIDHGMGLFSCVGPLSRTGPVQGDEVEADQSLGQVILDAADKPEPLYWSVFLNGTAVNPFLVSNLTRAPLPDADQTNDTAPE